MTLPLDPDLDPRPEPSQPLGPLDWSLLGMVAVGGFAGGLLRYGLGKAFPTATGHFPATTFVINTTGALLLAVVLVLLVEAPPEWLGRQPRSRLLRPLVATGFCGAYTTFSSVATSVDQLAAHGHPALAAVYLAASLAAGLAAAAVGIGLVHGGRSRRGERTTPAGRTRRHPGGGN